MSKPYSSPGPSTLASLVCGKLVDDIQRAPTHLKHKMGMHRDARSNKKAGRARKRGK